MILRKSMLSLVLLMLCFTTVFSESFGLKELLDTTVRLNPDIKIQDILLENSEMSRKISFNGISVPDIDLSYTHTSDKYPGTSATENGIFTLRLSKNFPGLFMSDKYNNQISILNLQKEKLKYTDTRNALIFTAYDYYFRIVRKVNELEVHRTNMKLIDELLKVAKINVDAGTGLKSDVLRVEAQKINIEIQFESTKNELKNIMLGLNAFLNNSYREIYDAVVLFLDNGGDLGMYGIDPSYKFKSEEFDIEKLLDDELENLPKIQMYRKDINSLKSSVELAVRDFYPDVNLSLSKNEVDHTDSPASVKDNDYSMSIIVSQKLYDKGNMNLKLRQVRNLLKSAELNYDYQKSLTEALLRNNVSDYMESVWRTEASEKSTEHAEENMRLVSERYQAGDAGVVELIDAQILMTDNKLSSIKAYYDERMNLGTIYRNINKIDNLWRMTDEKRK